MGSPCTVVGMDLRPTEPLPVGPDVRKERENETLPPVLLLQGDFTTELAQEKLRRYFVQRSGLDVVLSDMCSHQRSGVAVRDFTSSVALNLEALNFAVANLSRGGHFVCKLLGGESYTLPLVRRARECFEISRTTSPEACRQCSAECYLVAMYHRNGPVRTHERSEVDGTLAPQPRKAQGRHALIQSCGTMERFGLDTWPGLLSRRGTKNSYDTRS